MTGAKKMPIDFETIDKLIKLMESHGLNELQVKEGELEFKARRGEPRPVPYVFQQAPGIVHAATNAATPPGGVPALPPNLTPEGGTPQASPGKPRKEICSPIVGTFYRRPNPSSPVYKDVGDRVEKDDTVCIIEAMKVMNEIKAGMRGVVKKILAEDKSPVEFNQPLFIVELDE